MNTLSKNQQTLGLLSPHHPLLFTVSLALPASQLFLHPHYLFPRLEIGASSSIVPYMALMSLLMVSSDNAVKMDVEDTCIVDALVNSYSSLKKPSPALHSILGRPEELELLCDSVERRIQLIKRRSLDIANGQITIYDKALLALAKESSNGLSIGALELYISEILGAVTGSSTAESERIVKAETSLIHSLRNAAAASVESSHSPKKHCTRSSKKHRSYRAGRKHRPATRDSPASPTGEAMLSIQDEMLAHVLDVYKDARAKFYKQQIRQGADEETARFLRDTAENAINYMRAKGLTHHERMSELENVFAIARDKAAELAGGRQRNFERYISKQRTSRDERHGFQKLPDLYRPSRSRYRCQ